MSSRPLQYENLPTSEAFVFEEKVKNKKNITSHEHVTSLMSVMFLPPTTKRTCRCINAMYNNMI